MCKKITLFLSILLLFHVFKVYMMDLGNKVTSNNYGPYKLEVSHYEKCKGPKEKELSKFDFSVVSTEDKYEVTHNLTFHEQGRVDEVKIVVYTFNEKTKTVLYNYRIQKPCQHFVIAETIRIQLKASDCLVKKGVYSVVVDYLEYSKIFFGKTFFYGEIYLKVNVLSSKGNILCMNVTYNFKKSD